MSRLNMSVPSRFAKGSLLLVPQLICLQQRIHEMDTGESQAVLLGQAVAGTGCSGLLPYAKTAGKLVVTRKSRQHLGSRLIGIVDY